MTSDSTKTLPWLSYAVQAVAFGWPFPVPTASGTKVMLVKGSMLPDVFIDILRQRCEAAGWVFTTGFDSQQWVMVSPPDATTDKETSTLRPLHAKS